MALWKIFRNEMEQRETDLEAERRRRQQQIMTENQSLAIQGKSGGLTPDQIGSIMRTPTPSNVVGRQDTTLLPEGFGQGRQGQLVPYSSTGVSSAVGPDLTERKIAAGAQPGTNVAITPAEGIAEAARSSVATGGVRQVTPSGVKVMQNLNYSTNSPADRVLYPGMNDQQRGKAVWADYAKGMTGLKSAAESAGVGMTREAQVGRARQLEQDQINREARQSANEAAALKMQTGLMSKMLPAQVAAQGGVDQEYVKRGIDPATGQPIAGAGQGEQYEEGADGVLRGSVTGKPAPMNVQRQYEANRKEKETVEAARELTPAKKPTGLMRFFGAEDNVYGYDPKTGKFKEFGNQGDLNKDKRYVPLTPEQQKAYEEGNKGLASAAPAQMPAAPAPAQQAGQERSVMMVAPDGSKQFVKESQVEKYKKKGAIVSQ